MKRVKEERVISVNVYEALDGTKFDNQRDCEIHDATFLSSGNRRLCSKCNGKGTITIPGHYEKSYVGFFTEDNVPEYWIETRDCNCPTCNGKGYQELRWA